MAPSHLRRSSRSSFGFDIAPEAESNLDFQASIPLIWPQKTVLFQTDDEWYEEVGTPELFQ